MIEVYTGHLADAEPGVVERTPEEAAWLAYVRRDAAPRWPLTAAEVDALRREYRYLPRRRWWRR